MAGCAEKGDHYLSGVSIIKIFTVNDLIQIVLLVFKGLIVEIQAFVDVVNTFKRHLCRNYAGLLGYSFGEAASVGRRELLGIFRIKDNAINRVREIRAFFSV